MIDQVVNDRGISHPARFHEVKGSRVIEIRVGLPGPRNVVEEFEDGCTPGANLAYVGPQQLPAIEIDRLNLRVINFQEWNVLEEPRGVGSEILFCHRLARDGWLLRWGLLCSRRDRGDNQ